MGKLATMLSEGGKIVSEGIIDGIVVVYIVALLVIESLSLVLIEVLLQDTDTSASIPIPKTRELPKIFIFYHKLPIAKRMHSSFIDCNEASVLIGRF